MTDSLTPARQRGFTIVEMMIAVTIFALLASVALPGFVSIARGQRVKAASFELFATLTFARSEAITRNRPIVIDAVDGDWGAGWQVLDGDDVIRRQEAFPDINISGPSEITFKASGRLLSSVSGFDISSDDPNVHGRCVTIDLSGRPVSTSEAC